MKGVVFTADEKMYVKDFIGEPLYKSIGEAVDGYIKIVHPRYLREPYVMIVNEEGLLHQLPLNPLGCVLYGTMTHKQPIVGNLVIMKEVCIADGEKDLEGLSDEEVREIIEFADRISDGTIEEVKT